MGKRQLRAKVRTVAPGAPTDHALLARAAALRARRTRTQLDWSPARYASAVRQADGGTLRQAAEFVDWILTDGRVSGALEQATAMFGLAPRFECDEALASQLAVDMPRDFAECEQERLFVWGIVLGIGVARAEYTFLALTDPHLTVTCWDMANFSIRREYADGIGVDRIYVQTETGEECVEPGRGWIVYTPFGRVEPQKRGLWRKLARPVLGKDQFFWDRVRTSEVTPIIVGMTQGLSEPQRAQFLTDLQLTEDTRIVLPAKCDVKAVDVASGTRGTIQKDGIDDAKEEIATIILGTAVTVEGSSGFSNGDVQMGAQEAIARKREQSFSTCLGEQWATPWARIAYGYQGPAIYPRWIGAGNTSAEIPEGVSIDLTPSDIATVVKVDQFLASLQLPPIGGEDGGLTVAQYQAKNAATIAGAAAALDGEVAPVAATPAPGAPVPAAPASPELTASAPTDDVTDEETVRFAEQMTEHQVSHCEHGRRNRCDSCGVERVREVTRGEDGEPVFSIRWRPVRTRALSAVKDDDDGPRPPRLDIAPPPPPPPPSAPVVPDFASRNAAFLADLKDLRTLGAEVDEVTIQRLAKLHDVPAVRIKASG